MSGGPRRGDVSGPLAGVRILEIAQNLAGPLCGRLLADFGAEVVKLEPPGGDVMRNIDGGARGLGNQFTLNNGGKKSIVVDLDDPGDRPIRDGLIGWADAIVIALKPEAVRRYGLTAEALGAINPRAVVATLSGLGAAGPQGDEGGYDIIAQAVSGLGFVGAPDNDGVPGNIRPAYSDFGTAMATALGVVTALLERERGGAVRSVDTSLLATALTFASPLVSRFSDEERRRPGDGERGAGLSIGEQRRRYNAGQRPPYLFFQYYRATDGFVAVAALSAGLERKVRAVLGLTPDEDLHEAHDVVVERFASDTTEAWLARLRAAGIPCARMNRPDEVADDPQVVANGYFAKVVAPDGGVAEAPAGPIGFSGWARGSGPAPSLDGDRDEVLAMIPKGT